MPVKSIPELLLHELGDLLFAERTILKALRGMIRETSGGPMRERLEQHYTETEQQIGNIEQAFAALGERAKAEKCPGILGIVKEHDEFKSDEAGSAPILEAFDLGSGLRVEHYEIAGYTSAIAVARSLGAQQVVDLLQANLEQEQAMADFIVKESPMALETARANAESAPAMKRGAKKGAATKSAAKQATKKSTSTKSAAKKSTANRSTANRSTAKKASTGASRSSGARTGAPTKSAAKKSAATKSAAKSGSARAGARGR